MFFRIVLVFLVFLAYNREVHSQADRQALVDSLTYELTNNPKKDSLRVNKLLSLAGKLRHSDPQKSLLYAQQALEISDSLKFQEGISDAFKELFYGHFFLGSKSDSLLKYAELSKKQLANYGDGMDSIGVYWSFALYYGNIGRTDKELDTWMEALEIVRRYDDPNGSEAKLLNNVATVFSARYDTLNALIYFKQALKIGKEKGPDLSRIDLGNMNLNVGTQYLGFKDSLEYATSYLNEALRLYKSVQDYGGVSSVLTVQAKMKQIQGKDKEAERLNFMALDLAKEHDLGYLLGDIYDKIAVQYFKKKDYRKVITYGEEALKQIKEQENYYNATEFLEALHLSHAKLGNYERAYEVQSEMIVLTDSMKSVAMETKVKELQATFKVEQAETENRLLKAENAANEKELESKNYLALVLFLGILLVGTLAGFSYRSSVQKKDYSRQLEKTVAERTFELQETNKELEQANYELRTYSFIASHDIKEPIRNIGNFVGLLKNKLPLETREKLLDYFDIIQSSVNQLYILIEDFARYSSMSKDGKVELGRVDLNTLLGNLEVGLQETLAKTNGELVYNGLPEIMSSSSLLYSALKNLIENGLKFNESETPTVEVIYDGSQELHRIEVKDNGIGINPKYQDQVFDMFKRLHPRGVYEGTGMGLAIAKLVVEKLDGRIGLNSEAGMGSTFLIEFPKKDALK
ncbi:MAG: ATP-binding protein [Bacteroidia bacterium]|nr:ATP-binding protein [Bacteroidia bacterium]